MGALQEPQISQKRFTEVAELNIHAERFIIFCTEEFVSYLDTNIYKPGPEVINIFMLNSAEREIFPAHKCKNANKKKMLAF